MVQNRPLTLRTVIHSGIITNDVISSSIMNYIYIYIVPIYEFGMFIESRRIRLKKQNRYNITLDSCYLTHCWKRIRIALWDPVRYKLAGKTQALNEHLILEWVTTCRSASMRKNGRTFALGVRRAAQVMPVIDMNIKSYIFGILADNLLSN